MGFLPTKRNWVLRSRRRGEKGLRTILTDHDDLNDKFVFFLDIDGVVAPYGLDPKDDDADDDRSHFQHDDDARAKLQEHHCWRPFTDDTMAALSSILEAVPADRRRVILSSFWRFHANCRVAILDTFHAYGEQNGGPLKDLQWFDGRTGEVDDRQTEIADWLVHNNPHDDVLAGWLVLDDRVLMGEYVRKFHKMFKGHVIVPDEDLGLTAKDAEEAVALISEQLAEA